LGLTAALTAGLAAAGCTSSPASSAAGTVGAQPAITAARARQVFDHDAKSGSYAYRAPVFYLPETAGYPRFFVASVTRAQQGAKPLASASTLVGGAQVPVDGTALMLFEEKSEDAPWLLGSVSALPAGTTVPPLAATDESGYIPTVRLSEASLVAQPDDAGPLQAAVVDDGQKSAAAKVVADGPLTTGMYEGALNHLSGLTAPRGDVYQWELEGVNTPEFALRTKDGGALVFYTMTLNTTVAVPGYVNEANPVRSGPPIPVPASLKPLLPKNEPAPLVQLSVQQTLSFAAVDPPRGPAKIQVIAIGAGPASASAS
jgi:hypothetical protein